mmetsp:Transcript_34029/g.81662  ORF Transcript_34029/g.81662 Transcript_34029/m.81662 type:complete len:202 (-) Transcript_34029:2677-3282(-)
MTSVSAQAPAAHSAAEQPGLAAWRDWSGLLDTASPPRSSPLAREEVRHLDSLSPAAAEGSSLTRGRCTAAAPQSRAPTESWTASWCYPPSLRTWEANDSDSAGGNQAPVLMAGSPPPRYAGVKSWATPVRAPQAVPPALWPLPLPLVWLVFLLPAQTANGEARSSPCRAPALAAKTAWAKIASAAKALADSCPLPQCLRDE